MFTNQWRKRDAGIGMIAPTVVRTLTCEVEMASLIHLLSSGLRPDGYPTRADREPRAEDDVLSVPPAKPCTIGSVLSATRTNVLGFVLVVAADGPVGEHRTECKDLSRALPACYDVLATRLLLDMCKGYVVVSLASQTPQHRVAIDFSVKFRK